MDIDYKKLSDNYYYSTTVLKIILFAILLLASAEQCLCGTVLETRNFDEDCAFCDVLGNKCTLCTRFFDTVLSVQMNFISMVERFRF